MTTSTEFTVRTRLIAGRGCVAARLPEELSGLGVATVAVIADRGFAEAGLLGSRTSVVGNVCYRFGI